MEDDAVDRKFKHWQLAYFSGGSVGTLKNFFNYLFQIIQAGSKFRHIGIESFLIEPEL